MSNLKKTLLNRVGLLAALARKRFRCELGERGHWSPARVQFWLTLA
jgi:hypothetical protein